MCMQVAAKHSGNYGACCLPGGPAQRIRAYLRACQSESAGVYEQVFADSICS